MNWSCFLLTFLGCLGNSRLENLNVSIDGKVITIRAPNDPAVSSRFFSIELQNDCLSQSAFTYSADSRSSTFVLKDDQQLADNDTLTVHSVVERNRKVLATTNDFKIDGAELVETIRDAPALTCPISGVITFEDNFNDNQLNSTTWKPVVYSRMYTEHSEYAVYRNDPRNCYVRDGMLHLVLTHTDAAEEDEFHMPDCTYESPDDKTENTYYCGPYRMSGKHITPKLYTAVISSKVSFKYGRFDIKAKMPIGNWLFPQMLLYPESLPFETTKMNEEHVRIASVYGDMHLLDASYSEIGGKFVYGTVYTLRNFSIFQEYHHRMPHKYGNHFGDHFHVYSLIWLKDRITFMVDDEEYGEIKDPEIMRELNRKKYNIVLGLSVGGSLQYKKTEMIHSEHYSRLYTFGQKGQDYFHEHTKTFSKTWKQPKLVIDYVRIFNMYPGR